MSSIFIHSRRSLEARRYWRQALKRPDRPAMVTQFEDRPDTPQSPGRHLSFDIPESTAEWVFRLSANSDFLLSVILVAVVKASVYGYMRARHIVVGVHGGLDT